MKKYAFTSYVACISKLIDYIHKLAYLVENDNQIISLFLFKCCDVAGK